MVAPAIEEVTDPSRAPVRVANSVHLRPGPLPPRTARRLVAQVCQRADVGGRIADDAAMIAGELVNISLHQVFSVVLVLVQTTDRGVIIAVQDGGLQLPVLGPGYRRGGASSQHRCRAPTGAVLGLRRQGRSARDLGSCA